MLILLGLTGKIEIQQVKVGTNTKYIRVLSILIGILFIILSLLFELHVFHKIVNDSSVKVPKKIDDLEHDYNKEILQKNFIPYTHIINVSGSDGISLRTKALDKNEFDELQLGSKEDDSYITTLMNGHKIQILSKTTNWYHVITLIDGKIKKGFISGYYRRIPTVKKISTLYLWKGMWHTTWNNPMLYNTTNNQIIEFYNNDLSSFFGRYTYNSKKSQVIEGKIFNIVFNKNNLTGDWIENSYEGNEVCQGHLEFLMFSDKKSFIGRYNRKCKNPKKYRIWKGVRKLY